MTAKASYRRPGSLYGPGCDKAPGARSILSPGPVLGIVEPYLPHRAKGHKSCEGRAFALPGRLRHSSGGMACRGGSLRVCIQSRRQSSQGKGQAAACTRPRLRGRRRPNLVYIRTIIWPVNKGSNVKPLGMDKYPESCY